MSRRERREASAAAVAASEARAQEEKRARFNTAVAKIEHGSVDELRHMAAVAIVNADGEYFAPAATTGYAHAEALLAMALLNAVSPPTTDTPA